MVLVERRHTLASLGLTAAILLVAAPGAAQQLQNRTLCTSGNTIRLVAAGAMQGYQQAVAVHLRRHHRYPAESRARDEEGTAVVRFRIDRNGSVISSWIVSSSGHETLDQEALGMVQRAQPFPALPTEWDGDYMEFVVPIKWTIH